MSRFSKIAVTVPTDTLVVVEQLRRKLGKSRSAVVAMALEDWVRAADVAEVDRRYAEAYLRAPEAIDENRAVAAQATARWPPWTEGASSRAAESRAPLRRPRTSRR